MPLVAFLRRLRRRSQPTAPPRQTHDRSELLRELEVAVPPPERIVRWDTANGARRLSRT